MHPLVSIIIPIYNVEAFLPQCLDSVISQSYNNLEIILINDGSPDKSDTICKKYLTKDSRIHYVSQKNRGLSNARNNGMALAHGKYIFFLDSDDYLSHTCIEEMVKSSTSNNLPITGFIIDFSDKNKLVIPDQSYGDYKNIHDFLQDFYKFFATKSNFAWGKLYDVDIIKSHNLKFEEGVSLVEDILFNIQYYSCFNGGISLIPDNGYYYRQHGNSTLSKRFNPKMFDWNEFAYSTIRDFLLTHDAMTLKNRTAFYNNVLGNLLYSIGLLKNAQNCTQNHKVELIKQYTSTQLAKEVFYYSTPKSLEIKIAAHTLSCGNIAGYLLSDKFFNILRKIRHAFN